MHQPQQLHMEKGLRRWNPFFLNTLYSEQIYLTRCHWKWKKNATGTRHFGVRVYFYISLVTKLSGHLWPWLPGQGKAGTRSFVCLIKSTKKSSVWHSSWLLAKTLHQGSPLKSTSPGRLLPTLGLNHVPLLPSCRATTDLAHKALGRYIITK